MRSAERAGAGSLARLGDVLSERLLLLLQAVVVGAAALYLRSIWDLAESPARRGSAVVEAGVQVGETRFTVGRLLLAGLAVYLAFVASWILRACSTRPSSSAATSTAASGTRSPPCCTTRWWWSGCSSPCPSSASTSPTSP